MNFNNRHNQGPVFIIETGGIGAGGGSGAGNVTPAKTAADAQEKVGGGTSDPKSGYENIFNQQMQKQMELYAVITNLNDKKNEQSSFLSLAKSVSEMV